MKSSVSCIEDIGKSVFDKFSFRSYSIVVRWLERHLQLHACIRADVILLTYVTIWTISARNDETELLRMICHISFTNLNILILSNSACNSDDNRISNVEMLAHMNFGNLRLLELVTFLIILENNNLTQLKALNKLYKINDTKILIKFQNNFLILPSVNRAHFIESMIFNFQCQIK